jgi:hypothetical protein
VRTRPDDIKLELEAISPAVANLPSELPFAVPEGYFERLPDQVLSLVRADGAMHELEELSPVLAGLRNTPSFSVPEGYFATIRPEKAIPNAPLDKMDEQKETAVVRSIGSSRGWFRLSAAASVFGLIALAAWLMTNRPEDSPQVDTARLDATAPAMIMNDTLAVSDDALAGFLLGEDILPAEDMPGDMALIEQEDLAILDLTETRIQDLLKDIPDAALEMYVTENPDSQGTLNMN